MKHDWNVGTARGYSVRTLTFTTTESDRLRAVSQARSPTMSQFLTPSSQWAQSKTPTSAEFPADHVTQTLGVVILHSGLGIL